MRSFRSILALRVGLGTLGGALLLVVVAFLVVRSRMLSTLDDSLQDLAELEASYGGDSVSSEFHFRSERFRQPVRDPRQAVWGQLLTRAGTPLILSASLSSPMPVPPDALAQARLGKPAFITQQLSGPGNRPPVTIRTVIYPMRLTGPSHADHLLQISASLGARQADLERFLVVSGGLALLATGFAGLGTLLVAGRALQPAVELARTVEAIEVNQLSRRVAVPGDFAELHRMAVAFNGLLDRIERAVNGTRRFTSDASHELRAPLTVLRGELELALQRPRSSAEYEEALRRCLDEVLRLSRLADDLLTLTRVEGGTIGGTRSVTGLDELVGRAVERNAALLTARAIAVDVSGTSAEITCDPELVVRALDGMLEHAIMASPEQGSVRIRLESHDGTRGILITDGGPGLTEAEVAEVFKRFHRSREARTRSNESGLGLAIAKAVAQRHGGSLEFAGNDPGASFRLSLPAALLTDAKDQT